MKALATAGVIDQPEIDAERERDSTAAGHRNAEGARAARPSTDAKAAAWQAAMVDDLLPNITVRAIAEGFAGPGQNEVLAPYADEYFATIADVWGRRSMKSHKPSWWASTLTGTSATMASPERTDSSRAIIRQHCVDSFSRVATALRGPAAQRFDREGSR